MIYRCEDCNTTYNVWWVEELSKWVCEDCIEDTNVTLVSQEEIRQERDFDAYYEHMQRSK